MLVLEDTRGLALGESLFCGQCFRWTAHPDGTFTGIAAGRAVRAGQRSDGAVVLEGLAGPPPETDAAFWRDYFALDVDYPALLQTIRAAHQRLAPCVDAAPGIRVLRQPFFETLLTFLISQNNNIPRIRAIVDRLCSALGAPLAPCGAADFSAGAAGEANTAGFAPASASAPPAPVYHAFPTAEALAVLSEPELAFLRAGWRSDYLLSAARALADGTLDEAALRALPTKQARQALMQLRGVGPKVADCTLLFGLGRWDAYPVDVWMKRADKALFTARVKDAGAYLNRRTGGCAGIAQQYIFAWARENL